MPGRFINCIKTAAIKDDIMYCACGKANVLYEVDLHKWECKKLIDLAWEEVRCIDVYIAGDEVICVPYTGVRVAVYNIVTEEVLYYELENELKTEKDSVLIKEWIYFINRDLPGDLYAFSVKHKMFEKDILWRAKLQKNDIKGKIYSKCFLKDDVVCTANENKIILYNPVLRQLVIKEIYDEDVGIRSVIINDDLFYFVSGEKVFAFKESENELIEFKSENNRVYQTLIKMGNYVLINSEHGIDCLDERNSMSNLVLHDEIQKGAPFVSALKYKNDWILLPWDGTDFILISCDLKKIERHKIKYSMKDIIEKQRSFIEKDFTLNDLIESITASEYIKCNSRQKNEKGHLIYQGIKCI